jgi:hypothetical protein
MWSITKKRDRMNIHMYRVQALGEVSKEAIDSCEWREIMALRVRQGFETNPNS